MLIHFTTSSGLLSLAPALLLLTACSDLSDNHAEPGSEAGAPETGRAEAEQTAGKPTKSGSSTPITDPYLRADTSFSRFPLEKETTAQAIGRLVNGEDCDDDLISCEWEDEAGVRHIMGGDVLAIKMINLAHGDDRKISALGIGTARQRGQVLKNVRAFLPEIAIDCRSEEQSGEGDGLHSCGGSFEQGAWFKLIFDTNDYLVSARIDAFQIN